MKKMRAPTIGAPTMENIVGIENKDNKILFFHKITDVKNPHNKNVEDIFHLITGEKLKDVTRRVGDLWETGASMDVIREAKTDLLPAVSPANNPRLVIFDFDQHDRSLPISEVSTWLEGLENFIDRSGIALMRTRTSSGRGLHLYIKTDDSDKMRVYGAAKAFFATGGYKVDDSAGAGNKINTQKFYISHDDNARYNPESVIVDASFISKWSAGLFSAPLRAFCEKSEYSYQTGYKNATEDNDWDLVIRNIAAHVERKKPFAAGRSNHTVDLCYLCGKEGVPGDVLLDWLIENYADDSFTAYEIETTCFKRYEKGVADRVQENPPVIPSTYRIRFSDNIPPPVPILSYGGKIIGSEGNFVVVGGKAKTRKSFFCLLLCTAFIQKELGKLKGEGADTPGAVLWFDNEQGKSHAKKVIERLYKMCGFAEDNDLFMLYSLRELNVQQRADLIAAEVRTHQPRLVIIDGIVDICANFLDLEKSTATIQMLMTLTSEVNCMIIGVLHENKGKEDNQLRGHLGTIATQKAETVINLTRMTGADATKVEFTYTRNRPPESFCFEIDSEGLPVEFTSIGGSKPTPVQEAHVLFSELLKVPLGYSDLKKVIMTRKSIKERASETQIQNATNSGVIIKDARGMYSMKYDFSDDDEL